MERTRERKLGALCFFALFLLLMPGSTLPHKITVANREPSTAQQPVTVVSAASFLQTIAPEMIVACFGAGLATSTQVATTQPLPTILAGTEISIKDSDSTSRLAPLFFVSPGQVNCQIPEGAAIGTATVTVLRNGATVATGNLQITAVAPGLFAANANGQGVPSGLALRVKTDGAQGYEEVAQFDNAQRRFVPRPIDLGPVDDRVFLILFGTGIRGHSGLDKLTALIGGQNLAVSFAGPQGGFVGLDQVNVELPRSLTGRGEIDVILRVDGRTSNTLRINIR